MTHAAILSAFRLPSSIIGTITLLIVAATLATVTPTRAGLYTATYTGTLTGDAQDVTGLFGAAGSSLSGLDYTAVYLIDDSLAGAVPYVGVLDAYTTGSYVQGGSVNNTTALPVSATLTINGLAQSFTGDYLSLAKEARYNNADSILHYVSSTQNSIYLHIATYPEQPLLNGDFRDPLDYTLGTTALQNSGGSFAIYENGQSAFASMTVTHITIAVVPEPATWGLMLTGVMLAAVLRPARSQHIAGK